MIMELVRHQGQDHQLEVLHLRVATVIALCATILSLKLVITESMYELFMKNSDLLRYVEEYVCLRLKLS